MISFPCVALLHILTDAFNQTIGLFQTRKVLIKYRSKVPRLEVILSLNVIECFFFTHSRQC